KGQLRILVSSTLMGGWPRHGEACWPLAGCRKTRLLVSGQHESSITMRMTTPKEVRMRGDDQEQQGAMWSYVPMERRIPAAHPLRRMRPMVDGLLQELSPRFDELYSRVGRPSIAPEKLLRALLLQVLYTIRSERLLME